MKTTIEKLTRIVSSLLAKFNATDKPTLVMETGTAKLSPQSVWDAHKQECRRMPAGEVTPLIGSKAEIERMQAELHRILGNAGSEGRP
jgi:hypothetical protein